MSLEDMGTRDVDVSRLSTGGKIDYGVNRERRLVGLFVNGEIVANLTPEQCRGVSRDLSKMADLCEGKEDPPVIPRPEEDE